MIPATGCTEPISLALAAAKAREVLGKFPDKVFVQVSENIIKNTKSVTIPNTDHLKGIKAAVAAGFIFGKSNLNLDVLSQIEKDNKEQIIKCLSDYYMNVEVSNSGIIYDIIIKVYSGTDYAKVRISYEHTNFVLIEKNGDVLYKKSEEEIKLNNKKDELNVKDIIYFANNLKIEDVKIHVIAFTCINLLIKILIYLDWKIIMYISVKVKA